MLVKSKDASTIEDILTKIGFGRFQIYVIFILGFALFCDSSEILILVFIDPILKCFWHIKSLDMTLLTATVFIGTIIGACMFGRLSDLYGRKSMLLLGVMGIIYFGIVSSVSPTFVWFSILRATVAIFVGGNTCIISAYCTEVMPLDYRSTGNLALEIFWTIAPFFHTLLVMFLVPKFGWRLWIFITVLPMVTLIPFIIWLPESPRLLLTKNRVKEALKIIKKIAMVNKTETITEIEYSEPIKANFLDIFHYKYRLTTILVLYLWFLLGVSYYGFLQTSIINDLPHQCLQNPSKTSNRQISSNNSNDTSCCYQFTWPNFKTILIASLGEMLLSSITMIAGRFFKRKHIMFILVFVTMVMFFLINLCLSPLVLGIIMFFGRGSTSSLFGMMFLYNAEVYPTSLRGYALGFGSSFSRVGSILAQIIFSFMMIEVSFLGGTLLFSSMNFIGLVFIVLLPYETKNMKLLQGIDDEIECNNPIYKRSYVSYGSNKN